MTNENSSSSMISLMRGIIVMDNTTSKLEKSEEDTKKIAEDELD